jgi:hypothetical protein
VTSGRQADPALVMRIEACLREPVYFRDILDATRDQKYRAVLLAWSDIRTRHALEGRARTLLACRAGLILRRPFAR